MCSGIVRGLVALCTMQPQLRHLHTSLSTLPTQDDDDNDAEAGDGSLDMFMAVPIRVIAI